VSECIPGSGARDDRGYIRTARGMAHRVAYVEQVGPIPDGYHVHHECRNPECVNVEHLRALPPSEHLSLHSAERRTEVCPHGHSKADAYRDPKTGKRKCRTCQCARVRRYYHRMKGVLAA